MADQGASLKRLLRLWTRGTAWLRPGLGGNAGGSLASLKNIETRKYLRIKPITIKHRPIDKQYPIIRIFNTDKINHPYYEIVQRQLTHKHLCGDYRLCYIVVSFLSILKILPSFLLNFKSGFLNTH